MSNFHVGLKKVVDDSYDIEIGYGLEEKLVNDLKNGLVGGLHKFAVVTDDIVKDLHAEKICNLLTEAGFTAQLFVFPNGEKSKVRKTKEEVEEQTAASKMTEQERKALMETLTAQMKEAAKLLEFEHAAYLRDKIQELRGKKA